MVVDVESRAESMMGGKMAARACDACMRRSRASWYCPADDAFLCQSCDASIHSANHLSKRHERVQLQSSSTLPELMTATRDKTTSVWYEGFRRKARTPRSKLSQIEDVNNSNDPLVPELGVEEEEDGVFSFSSTDENEESLNCCVPVFDTFSDMVIDDIDSFRLVPDGVNNSANGEELGELEREIMGNEGLIEFLPLDMDLGELITMDVESLLEEEEPFLGVKEVNSIGVIKEENNVGFEISSKELERVKDEEEEEAKCVDGGSRDSDREASKDEDRKMSLFLRLDYESVISAWDIHGSPWKTGIKPEFNLGDWRECLIEISVDPIQLGGNTYPSHVMGGFEELASAVGSVTRQQGRDGGRSNGERGAKVLRYREKRRTRLFAKKIRYEVRKLNAEQRPRIKGRFVKRTSLST